MVWRPKLPNSIDEEPLTVEISDFYLTFPYERLASSNAIVSFFMRPEVPVALVLFYLTSKSLIRYITRDLLGIDGTGNAFKAAVAIHNLGLALFSFVVFINSVPIVVSHYASKGMMAVYCDVDGSLWRTNTPPLIAEDEDGSTINDLVPGGLGPWATIFYISKYYEFVDTWILIMKGKKASFLQTIIMQGLYLLCMAL